jgi:hypothetical protein
MRQLKQYKLKVDSKEKIEELLQEIYAEACKNIEEAQNEINKISNSTDLNSEIIDGKAKYAKAINDFIATKDKAIARKFEIAKLLTEIVKFNGNVQQAFTEGEVPGNWDDIVVSAPNIDPNNNNGPIEYTLR